LPGEVGVHGLADDVEDVSGLLAARLDDRQDRFDESTASSALRAERQFSPDDRVTQTVLTGMTCPP
jgi:hypothetical protein